MDVTALLVFVSGFVVCAGVVFLISIFGAKEETFEEALAKQRKANEKEKKREKDKKKDENSGKKNKNWRMKKKGERDDKNDGMEDVDEEPVVVVPAGAKVEDVVEPPKKEEMTAPVNHVEPKPKKEKKKKIEIQEVEAVPETSKPVVEAVPKADDEPVVPVVEETVQKEAAPVVENVKPVKASPTKQKVKKDKVPTEAAAAPPTQPNPKELLSVIKKTSFSDQEAQKLIDVLLTKQSGDALNTSDDWIEKGKPTETQKLKQELSETLQHLEEERMRVKSFSDKVNIMRRELNEEKAAKANFNRSIEEFQKARGQEVGAINSRLQQVINENTILKNNLQNELALRRNVELSSSHFQATIDNLNSQLEMAKIAASQAKANDPHLLTELEQLRTLRDKYENTLAEINIKNSNLKNQINQQNDEISSIKQQLSSSSDKVSQLSSSNSNLEKTLAAKSEEAQKVAAELKALKSKPKEPAIINNNNINVAEIEAELAAVKQRLSDKEKEAASLVAENKKLGDQVACSKSEPAAAVVNGHAESSEWRDKFESLQQEHEKMVAKQKALQSDYETEVSSYKGQVDSLKSKNNDLSKSLTKEKKTCQDVLHRLFPSLSSSSDLETLETQAAAELVSLGKSQDQVAHYQSVLAQTESMLTSLQSSVEAAESEWRNKLDIANQELTQLKSDKSATSQTEHIKSNQMSVQLSDLQQRLAKEEEDRVTVVKINEKLQATSEELDKEVERLSKELSESKKRQDELTSQVKELQITNINLKDAVTHSQEALAKEQNIVKSFQEQVSNGKLENGQSPEAASDSNNLSVNSIPPSISTPSIASIDSTTNTTPEKKKISKKKKLLGLFKTSS